MHSMVTETEMTMAGELLLQRQVSQADTCLRDADQRRGSDSDWNYVYELTRSHEAQASLKLMM